MSRIFSIADIHGRFDLLKQLFKLLYKHHKLDLTKDTIVFTGDYVDRGPQSAHVLRFVRKLTQQFPNNVIALLGNHEQMMIDYYEGRDRWGLWISNGGDKTRDSFHNKEPRKMIQWLKSLPLFHKQENFFFSHAPIPYIAEGPYDQAELTWSVPFGKQTESEFAKKFDNGVIGVCGHLHALFYGVREPRFYDHYIFGDAGCGCSSKAPLCAINVKTRDVIYSYPTEAFSY